MYPQADVPVVQLSINATKPLQYHLDLGARLNALREQGVLILASGNVVHNLRRLDWQRHDSGEEWAQRFDDAATALLEERPGDIAKLTEHPDFRLAAPTPDHFLPLLYIAGIAAADGLPARAWLRGCTLGSISMSCYGVGLEHIDCLAAHEGASVPADVPGDQTNL
jgi:Uncharacterized conserved protein